LLENAEDIKSSLFSSVNLIRDVDLSALEQLRTVIQNIKQITSHFPPANDYITRLESVRIELNDISDACEQNAEKIEFDPRVYEEARLRLDLLNKLLQKHQKESVIDLIQFQNELENKLKNIEISDETIHALKQKTEELYNELLKTGKSISASRKIAIPLLEEKLKSLLADLGMPKAKFEISLSEYPEPNAHGLDEVLFLFSANPDMKAEAISKVASGGEMSRLMLGLKSIIAESAQFPTIIFDEIDTGVSGEIAGKMGEMMRNLSADSQVISITHLPQVACQANTQFHVFKEQSDVQTKISIKNLTIEERIIEIAKMTSGKNINDTSLQHARHLLGL
jgi:DNA repair protein RecN (Recombination protein N)